MNLSIAAVLATLAALAALTEANEHRAAPSVRDNHSRFATRQAQALSPRLLSAGARIGGQGTWFNVEENEVDCGGFYKSSDFVVALNQPMYGNLNAKSPFCDRWITVYANGKSAKAKIVDACPESSDACHHGSLDMSQGLFKYFAGLDVGVIDIHWTMDDGTSGDGEVGGHGHGGGEHSEEHPGSSGSHTASAGHDEAQQTKHSETHQGVWRHKGKHHKHHHAGSKAPKFRKQRKAKANRHSSQEEHHQHKHHRS